MGERHETDRLRLERWDPARHTGALAAMNADAAVMRFIGDGRPLTYAESERASRSIAAHWERFGFGLWAVSYREPGRDRGPDAGVLGFAGLSHPLWFPAEATHVEVGWRLRRDAWGQGIASEAARAAVAVGRDELGLTRLVSCIQPGNVRSQAVARRLGMALGRVVAHPTLPGDLEVWELTAPFGVVAPRSGVGGA